jgi:predicted metal-dependent enzyme (double-stranded beta helix superfamily)
MTQTIEQFGAACHAILKQDSGAAGLEKIRQGLEEILSDETILATHLGPDADSERNILYEDPEFKFCIIAHVYKGAKNSAPHDHRPTWAIYGQAAGVTEMTEYRMVQAPADGKPGKAEPVKTYNMTPGMAMTYAVGALHSPKRESETRLIRIEGTNVKKITRASYERV